MSATNALHIYKANGTDKAPLRETISEIEGLISSKIVSGYFKNQTVSGDPRSGSVKVSRFLAPSVKDYGTARTAGKGDYLKDNYVTVNLDKRKEIVEEVNEFDAQQYGIDELLLKRREQYARAVANFLDRQFFAKAVSAGTQATLSAQNVQDKVEELVQSIETTSNGNVDGVDRDLIALSVNPYTWGLLKNYINTLPNPTDGGVKIGYFNEVEIHENTRQSVDIIGMAKGAIAQPAAITGTRLKDIDFSIDYELSLFFNYGEEAVMADLIKYANLSNVSA